jgi:hypothetical protein
VLGEVGRQSVDEMRAALVRAEADRFPGADDAVAPAVEIDLRGVTAFSRLGIAVLVAARRWFGDRLRIHGTQEILSLLHEAGLTRVLQLA